MHGEKTQTQSKSVSEQQVCMHVAQQVELAGGTWRFHNSS